jgi:hypothetical protein
MDKSLEPYLKEGENLLKQNKIREFLFSHGTYQIEVVEARDKIFWPFLQLDDRGKMHLPDFGKKRGVQASDRCLSENLQWYR